MATALSALPGAGAPAAPAVGAPMSAVATTVALDGASPGRTFDGVGAISGGGGNSRLLVDYPEPQRSQVLDYLFKPGYGAAVQLLKAEIGGDTNSTSGAEPSHQHTADDLNCDRGYEWWLMGQAKARNPNVQLLGLAWGAPGWIGNGKFWSADMADYVVRWLDCAKNTHHLSIDYLGGWNERGFDRDWFVALRSALDARGYRAVKLVADDTSWNPADLAKTDPAFAKAVSVYGAHYICGYRSDEKTCSTSPNTLASGKPIWAAENGSDDYNAGAAALARGINRGYIDAKITAYINWPVVAAITDNLPYPGMGVAVAGQPWSGAYSVGKSAWVMAHTTQFTAPGWRYLDTGAGYLGGNRDNGSYVSLRAPSDGRWSTVVETADATAAQTFTGRITGGLSTGAVHVWATKLAGGESFVRQPDVVPNAGAFTVLLQPGYVYTLSTATGQGKGAAASPAPKQMSLPWQDTFDGYAVGKEAKYLSDMQGAFEVTGCAGGRAGRCVRQMTPRLPILWSQDMEPYALLGDPSWANYSVAVDTLLDKPGYVQLIGRAGWQKPAGLDAYFLRAGDDGQWSLYRSDVERAAVTLASGRVAALGVGKWHRLGLTFSGTTITATIDGVTVGTATDRIWAAGQVGIATSQGLTAQFDNLSVTAVDGPAAPVSGRLVGLPSSRCLDVKGASRADGATTLIWKCTGGMNQQWTRRPDGTLEVYGDKCLDVLAQATAPGSPVGIWGCNGGANQQWRLNPDGTIVGVQSGLCLDVSGAGTADDTPVVIWTCAGAANQRWTDRSTA
jgi:hypothetical protein